MRAQGPEIGMLDLFSGIGGFALGFREAGFRIVRHAHSETDRHALAVYRNHFKESEHAGAVEDVLGGWVGGRPDLVTFGSPCQDFSIAGNRAGLGGARSGLFRHAVRIVDALRPRFFVWENVKGAFSTNGGADFWSAVRSLADLGGYRLEWQLLNTKRWLPQNRERLYLVGHLAAPGGGFRPLFPLPGGGGPGAGEGGPAEGGEAPAEAAAGTLTANYGKRPTDGTYIECGTFRMFADRPGLRATADGTCPALLAQGKTGGSGMPCVRLGGRLRMLTEIECERLQGFPDDWTATGDYDGEIRPVPAGHRYRTVGNAVTVPVVRALAERLRESYFDD